MKTHLLSLSAIILLYCFLARHTVPHGPYHYDEADYMFAASQGLAANYTDSPTLPITDFARIGMSQGPQADKRMALSESIRAGNDIVFYRHWHGPPYFYFLLIANSLHLDEHTTRSVMLIVPILSMIVVYLGLLWLIPGLTGALAAGIASALLLWSYITVTSTELAPHQLLVLCYLTALFLLAKMVVTGERKYWFGAVVATALAFCVMEIAFGLILTLLICFFLERRRLKVDFSLLARSVLLFVVTVLIVWPGAILKLSFLKAYAFMVYLAVYRKNAWGGASIPETWWIRFSNSPVEWILIAAAVILFFRMRGLSIGTVAYPFLIFGFVMILANMRVATETPRYALPFQPALDVFAGMMIAAALAPLPARIRVPVIGALCVALFLNTLFRARDYPAAADAFDAGVLRCIREHNFEDKSLLVPQGYVPMLHYYFPKARLRGYVEKTPPLQAVTEPQFDGVLYGGDRVLCGPAQ